MKEFEESIRQYINANTLGNAFSRCAIELDRIHLYFSLFIFYMLNDITKSAFLDALQQKLVLFSTALCFSTISLVFLISMLNKKYLLQLSAQVKSNELKYVEKVLAATDIIVCVVSACNLISFITLCISRVV